MRLVVGAVVTTAAWGAVVTFLRHGTTVPTLALVLTLGVATTLVTWWVLRGPGTGRHVVLLVVLGAALAQVPGLTSPPLTSSDAYRYVWDGRVQLSGTSPYRYAPLDDRLADLRDPVLFPGLGADQRSGYLTEPVPTDRAELAQRAADDPRVRINRPKVPTIYPPVAELWFTAVAAVTPWSAGTLGLQLGSALLAVLVAAALALGLRRSGRDPRLALWWAWCPVVLLETGNGGHVDIVAAVLLLAAFGVPVTSRGRRLAAGLLVGLAASVKLFPLVVLPALMPVTRLRWREALPPPVVAVLTLVVSYLPHVAVAGALVLGYVPGYLLEEGGGGRSVVLKALLPDVLATPVGALVLAGAAVWAIRRAVRGCSPAAGGAALLGTFLLVATPTYPWYAVPLLALAVASRRWEWFAVAVAGEVALLGIATPGVPTTGWVTSAVVVTVLCLWRGRDGWRDGWRGLPARLARSGSSRRDDTPGAQEDHPFG